MSLITRLVADTLSVILFHFLFVCFDSHDDDVLDHQNGSIEENIGCNFVSVSICSPAAPGSDCS